MMRPIPLLATVIVTLIVIYGLTSRLQMDSVELVNLDERPNSQIDDTIIKPIVHETKSKQEEASPLESQAFQQSVKGIAQSYAKQTRFPVTSMPIPDEEALQKYIPNKSSGASLPYEGPHGESWRFGLKTNKFRYFHGEPIEIAVQLTGVGNDVSANVSVSVLANRAVIYQAENGTMANGIYQTIIDTTEIDTDKWPTEIQLMAVAEMNGETMQVVETIRYDQAIASVRSVGKGEVEGEYLVIPVAIITEKTGYFRITGVLFSEESNKPLVHLEGKSKITTNNDTVNLKAHFQALQVSGEEGPYSLQHLWIEKMPSAPDYAAAFGVSDKDKYKITAHSFEEYTDQDFDNPSAERSLEFLNKISGTDEE